MNTLPASGSSPSYSPLQEDADVESEDPKRPLMEIARLRTARDSVQKFGCRSKGEPNMFEIDIDTMPMDELWNFILKHQKDRLSCAMQLMDQLEPYRRPYLCKAILESAGALPRMLQDPNRDELKKALDIIYLCKFASEEWLALPDPKRRRPDSPERA